jgi:hypothetical protein
MSFVVPSFKASDLHVELRDPGLTLVRLSARPEGHWKPPPARFRDLRVDPPAGHKSAYAVLYTANSAFVIGQECKVVTDMADGRWMLNLDREARNRIGRYVTTKAGCFIPIDGPNREKLFADTSAVLPGSYEATQAIGLELFRRFAGVAHGLCWESFHRHQTGRVYAVWHNRKTALGILAPTAQPLQSDGEWRGIIDALKAADQLVEIAA